MDLTRIYHGLYISGSEAARRAKGYYRICVSDFYNDERVAHSHYPINEYDLPNSFIRQMDHVADKAHKQMKKGRRVLIYCHIGVNRSVACCLYYLIKYERVSFSQAYNFVRLRHREVALMYDIRRYLARRYR